MNQTDHQPHSFKIKAHGLSKSDKPFQPTAPSTQVHIENVTHNTASGPIKLYDNVFENVGGILGYHSISEISRNVSQIKRVRNEVRWAY